MGEVKYVEARYCRRCDGKVIESELEEYSYQCLYCDEDLFEFETNRMNYQKALELVNSAISFESEADVCLVKNFAEVDETEKAIEIVAEQYNEAANGVDDFEMSVHEYILAILYQEDKIKNASYFENETEAEQDGFYWVDELDKWLKLQF